MNMHLRRILGIFLFAIFLVTSGIVFFVEPLVKAAPLDLLPSETITIDATGSVTPIDTRVRGTNLPAWLNPTRFADTTFHARTRASGTTLMRIPGGSWSNYYDWLACERGGQGIDAESECYWPWASRPTDFIDFLQATGQEAMYTVNMNNTAKEAAALVAFFNGSVDDNRTIGTDIWGRDWGTVGDWARLRRDNGNPEPLTIKLWEVGNELYGGNQGSGKDCTAWGWENVWTCDGTEYANGIGSGISRRQGYLEFREAMRAVDPTIQVGAIGVAYRSEWSNWGNEVVAAAGDVMDFYTIHHYAYFQQPASYADALAQPQQTWSSIMADAQAAFDIHAGGREVPIAVTEHNLFSVQEQDNNQWMTRAVNALFMADTIGQMQQHGVAMANQWDLANGTAANGTDYGLMKEDGFARNPQYYVFPLWDRFGDAMLPVTSSRSAETTLSVYAGRIDDQTLSLLAINKTGSSLDTTIAIDGVAAINGGTVDVVSATSLGSQSVTFNGVADPSDDLANAPGAALPGSEVPFSFSFAPYSITLLQMSTSDVVPTAAPTQPVTETPLMPTATAMPTVTPGTNPTGEALVYSDALAAGWNNWSWNTSADFATTSPRQSGSAAVAVTHDTAWAGFYLHTDAPLTVDAYDTLRFWVHGGSTGGQQVSVWLRDSSGNGSSATAVTPQAGTWTQVELPLDGLDGLSDIADIIWQDSSGSAQPTFYLDEIAFLNGATPVAPTATATSTAEPTATATQTAEPTAEPTATPTQTAEPTATTEPTTEPTVAPTATATQTAEPTATATGTAEPTATATSTPEPTATPDNPSGSAAPIYTDALASEWVNWSWNTSSNFDNTTPRQSGSASIAVTYDAGWSGFYLHTDAALPTAEYDTLRFWVHGGDTGGQQISVWLRDSNGQGTPGLSVTPQANTWTLVELPIEGLTDIADITWNENSGSAQPTFYLDEVVLLDSAAAEASAPQPTATVEPTVEPTATATVTVEPTATAASNDTDAPFLEENGSVVIEAEHFAASLPGSGSFANHTWESTTAYGDAVAAAMEVLPNSGANTQLQTSGPQLRYAINFSTAGDYYVYVRGYAPASAGNNDSIHVGLDGSAVTTHSGRGLTSFRDSGFTWQNRHSNSATRITIPAPGVYTFDLWMREDGTVIDRIWLTTASDAVANGSSSDGPPESPRTQ